MSKGEVTVVQRPLNRTKAFTSFELKKTEFMI